MVGHVALWIVATASWLVTISRVNMIDMYKKMGFSAAQLEMIRKMGIAEWPPGTWALATLPAAVLTLGFLLFVRRYFVHEESRQTS